MTLNTKRWIIASLGGLFLLSLVLVQAMAFFAAFLFAPKRGLLAPKGLPSPTPTGGGAPAPHGLFGNPRASLSAFGSGGSSAAKSRRSRPSTSRSA